jgi:predicted nucleotidyltransferase
VTFSTGYHAFTQGVAVGDFNDDGLMDIAVANSWNNNVGILLGYGDGTFSDQNIYSTGGDTSTDIVFVGDFNNDTQADILFNNAAAMGVSILLGYGNSSFGNPVNYATSTLSAPVSVATGDFNNDTLLDITVANLADSNIGVLLGFPNVDFMQGVTLSTGSSPGPRCIIASDFDKDGRLDFAVANYITNNVGVFRGDGNGNFPIQMAYSTGSISAPTFVTVGDFNKDDHEDIVVSNSGTNSLGTFLGYGNGSFGTQMTYPLADGSNPQSIACGDFNKDNRSDVVVANYGQDNVNVLLTYDHGSFGTGVPYSTGGGSSPHAIAVGDFNNDRRLDIVVANNLDHNFGIFYGNGDGTFSSQKIYPLGDKCLPVAVAVGDFNRDSLLDLVVVDNANCEVYVFLGRGDGNFSDPTLYYTGYGSWPSSTVVGDLNNDNRLDIVVGNFQTDTVGILFGNGDGTFLQQTTHQTISAAGLSSVALGDFNNDSCLDIAICNIRLNNVGILFGNGNGTFSYQTIYETSNGAEQASVAVADFDNDGRLDIVVANQGLDNLVVSFGNGNGSFSDQVTLLTGTGSQPLFVAVGDFNNDGKPDIVAANSQLNNVGVFLGYVNRIFFSQTTYSTGYNALTTVVVAADFNNDSRLDIAACNQDNDNIVIFLGYADEGLLSLPSYSTGLSSQPTYVATGDFNNDTRLDVAVANYGTDNVMILLGSGYGTFDSETTYSTGNGSHPRWIAIGDLNKDSRLDIVIANSGNDNVGVCLGNGNGTFSSQLTYSTGVKSQPSSVIIGDFNNDTLQDIAVANYGSNNVGVFLGYGNGSFGSQIIFSTGFNSRPYALTSGDVNNDNVSDILIANNEFGDIVIITKLC